MVDFDKFHQEDEERFRLLEELSPDAIAIQSQDKIVYVNPAGAKLFGAETSEQLIGKSVWDFVLPENRELVERRYRQMREIGTYALLVEQQFLRLDGSTFHAEVTLVTCTYEGKPTIQAIFRDITERKQSEEALEAAYAFQQSIIDGIAEPIMVIGTDYHVKLVNKAAREFSLRGIESSESFLCYQISHQRETPCDGTDHPCPLEQVRELNLTVTVVHEHHQANGERRLVEVTAAPFWNAKGILQGIIESIHDITEREQAEESLRQYTERLRALAAQLVDVEDTERQRLARELHDQVGQNLTALGINLNIIRSQLPEEIESLVRFRLDDSQSLVEQTTEVIRDMMANLRPPVLDDYGLVAAFRWYGEQFARRTNISIVVEGEEPIPRLEARVENALFRIVQEALMNVAKHANATQAIVTLDVVRKNLRLVIADDGSGFDTTHLSVSDGSRGWGLLTMNERAEAVGGNCHIESSPNEGTQVIVEVVR